MPEDQIFLKKLQESVQNYKYYIDNYLKPDNNCLGIDKIMKTIKIYF